MRAQWPPPGSSMPVVVGIDGHDGTGKTTIAKNIAARLGYSYRRPFGGETGLALSRAAVSGDPEAVIKIGAGALARAMETSGEGRPLILDRSWMTVASLVGDDDFRDRWTLWIPTVLCWADLPATLERLALRDEPGETVAWHRHYIDRYRAIAQQMGCAIVDTSHRTEEESTAETELVVLELLGSAGRR
ncbi:hypothetical protein ACFY5D_01010 [Paeniglutamicibacter sp. NPDC012692]|uniref:hypothetical protein n=1 Tax=Paeniglutamicibacter sp. NPDC012692 TaxID=3364388 RepID=UPI0036BA6A25